MFTSSLVCAYENGRDGGDAAVRSVDATLHAVVDAHLRRKHEAMRGDAFGFLRGTFYRWAQLWPRVCPDLQGAPRVLAVGDCHVNSFGTWRDAEGRLGWGVDDFDEAYPLPYANDLVRLAASAKIVIDCEQLRLSLHRRLRRHPRGLCADPAARGLSTGAL